MASDGQRWKNDAFSGGLVLLQFWVAMLDREFVIVSQRWVLIGFRWRIVDLLMTSAMVRVGRGVCARVRAGLWNWVNFERGKKIGLGGKGVA
jgi:hypothetical protein